MNPVSSLHQTQATPRSPANPGRFTTARTDWSPPVWDTVGTAGPDQRTPDLGPIIQEIINRAGRTPGNAMVLTATGTGTRTAESYNGDSSSAPLLHIEFSAEPVPNRPPVAHDDTALTVVDAAIAVDAIVNDTDPDSSLDPTTANTTCASCSDPSDGALLNHHDGTFTYTPNTGFIGDDSFAYEVCDVGMLCDTATVTVTVTSAAPQVAEVRVADGNDDAEESNTGKVSLTSGDLELVVDGNRGAQTVGMLFTSMGCQPTR